MYKVREFVKGRDESTWVSLLNTAYERFQDWRPITVEETFQEDSASFHFNVRWIAELNGKPVGTVRTFIHKEKKEDGFIDDLSVIPSVSAQELKVEKELAMFAVGQLEKHGVKVVTVPRLRWFDPAEGHNARFLEELGFNLTRKTSLMAIDLTDISKEFTGNKEVTMRPLRELVEEDVEQLNWLRNECSKDQFNFRLSTVDETRALLRNHPYSYLGGFFAMLSDRHVGFTVLAIDEKYNAEKAVKAGIILAVGVLKNYRRAGIGTRLVLHGLRELRAKHMLKAILDVDDLNQTRALELYERIGFKVLEKYLTFQKTMT